MRIFVAGHRGMVGQAVMRHLNGEIITKTRKELDLCDQRAVHHFISSEKPNIVIICAAKVGGISANARDLSGFLYENLMIQNNLIHASIGNVDRLCFLGSSCIYPRKAPQPIKEEALLSGPLEPTNEGYAIAKIAGLKLIEYYRKQGLLDGFCLMPCNLYGTGDNYDLDSSHVLAALVRKFVEADDEVIVWGTGTPRREFMHVDDLARAITYFLDKDISLLNIGWGEDISISELVKLIAKETGFKGKITYDPTMPDGTPQKVMDVSKMKALGFSPKITLREGIRQTIEEYQCMLSKL